MIHTMYYSPSAVAKMFDYVREEGPNRGARVEAIQHWALGSFGDSWCDEFGVGFDLDVCFKGHSPFPRTTEINASTKSALAYAKEKGWVTVNPQVDDLCFFVLPDGTPHHVAIVSGLTPLTIIAGNTSADGMSANGDRVAEHTTTRDGKVFVHYPRTWSDA